MNGVLQSPPRIPLKLTKTHELIVPLLSQGFTSQEISKLLDVKKATVDSHIHIIYQNNSVRSKLALVWRWMSERYAFLEKVDASSVDDGDHALLQTSLGMVAAEKQNGEWVCLRKGLKISKKHIWSVHPLATYVRSRAVEMQEAE